MLTILSRQLLLALLAGLALALPKNRNLTLALTKPVDIDHTQLLSFSHTRYTADLHLPAHRLFGLSISDEPILLVPLSVTQLHPHHLVQDLNGFCEFSPPSTTDAGSCVRGLLGWNQTADDGVSHAHTTTKAIFLMVRTTPRT